MTDPQLLPAGAAEMVIDLLTGHDDVDHVARTLDVPIGQVLGWCERVGSSSGSWTPTRETWRGESGDLAVSHTAHHEGSLERGSVVTFTVEVRNGTPTTLYGMHLVSRSFTNAMMDGLQLDTPWQFVSGSHAEMRPGDIQRYPASYTISASDVDAGGEIINAIAITGYTAAGHRIWIEEDANVALA